MIRPAALNDAEALGALQLSCWHEAYGELAPPGTLDADTVEKRVRTWTGLLEREMNVLVLEIDGELDGFAACGRHAMRMWERKRASCTPCTCGRRATA
jgi:hypothetical protein